MRSLLDAYDKQWMDAAHRFFNGMAQEAINETSLQLKGRKIATAKKYIPIHTDKNFFRTEIEGLKLDATIEGAVL